jgi:hypothetical protein
MESERINNFQVSQQYSVSEYRGKYILLTQDIWLSPNIYSFTSVSPVGPWENKKLVYTTPETQQGMFTYNAYVHPQFDRDGKMLVSYNTNGDFWSIFSNVEIYRPRFIRVPYMNLDYAFWPNHLPGIGVEERAGLMVYPNPAEDRTTLTMDLKESGFVSIQLLDVHGRLLQSYPEEPCHPGINSRELDFRQIPAGLILCKVKIDASVYLIPVIKSSPF